MADPQANLARAIQEVTEKGRLLVREEIELAKAEITGKVTKLVRGAVIGAAAGLFVVGALILMLFGFAYLAYWAIPFPDGQQFWGFFTIAAILLLLAALAGYLALRAFKAGSPPAPKMAIEEAKRIRATVTSDAPKETI
jgi:hypothetical protein